MNTRIALLILWFASSASLWAQSPAPASPHAESPKYKLKVALFPYIPASTEGGFSVLEQRIKKEFEAKNRNIELELRPFNPNDDFYDLSFLSGLLTMDPDGTGSGYHIVEIDSVLLGDVVDRQRLSPWRNAPSSGNLFPVAKRAMKYKGVSYGVPHWLCGFFVFSRNKNVADARSTAQLVDALRGLNTPIRNITGNFASSWDTPALYLNAWMDRRGGAGLDTALSRPLDSTILADFKLLANECRGTGKNPCTDKTYKDNNLAAQEFARSQSDATFGYSERLNVILKSASDKDFYVAPLQLSDRKKPLFFVDLLVLNKRCDAQCQRAARSFAEYLNSMSTYEWIIQSEDSAADRVPRYLLPASRVAYSAQSVAQDKYYQQFRLASQDALPLPFKGIEANGRCARSRVLEHLGEPPKPGDCPGN